MEGTKLVRMAGWCLGSENPFTATAAGFAPRSVMGRVEYFHFSSHWVKHAGCFKTRKTKDLLQRRRQSSDPQLWYFQQCLCRGEEKAC